MPESPDWADYGARLLQQQSMDEVNNEYADYIRKNGEFAARQIKDGGSAQAGQIRSGANSGLLNAGLNAAFSVAGAGMDAGWFGGSGGKEITGLTGFGKDQASFVPGIDELPTLYGSPSPTTPVYGDSWIVGDRIV